MLQLRGQSRSILIDDRPTEDPQDDPDPSNLPPVDHCSPRFWATSHDGNEGAPSPREGQATPPLELRQLPMALHDVPSTSTHPPLDVTQVVTQRLGKGLALEDSAQLAPRESQPPYLRQQNPPRALPLSQAPKQYPQQYPQQARPLHPRQLRGSHPRYRSP